MLPEVDMAVAPERVQLQRLRQVCAEVRRQCEAQRKMIALTLEKLALQTEKVL